MSVPDGEWVHASAPYLKPRTAGQVDAWTAEAAGKGREGTQRVVQAGEVEAPKEVAHLLGLSEGAAVVARRRIMFLDGDPTELTDTYFPVGIARGTALADVRKIRGGAVTLLADLGHVARAVREDVRARMPDSQERESLNLGAHDPVLTLTRVVLNAEGAPFQVDVSIFPATSQRLTYEMRMD
ncbi:GntR family transcriptional regulator [Streptomyces jumonjinensis]|uniref:GntR family transcriptional regulator n=1 Tax=Streptomyces jumonjinensis TaxID=1945 RepID=UPI00378B1EA0